MNTGTKYCSEKSVWSQSAARPAPEHLLPGNRAPALCQDTPPNTRNPTRQPPKPVLSFAGSCRWSAAVSLHSDGQCLAGSALVHHNHPAAVAGGPAPPEVTARLSSKSPLKPAARSRNAEGAAAGAGSRRWGGLRHAALIRDGSSILTPYLCIMLSPGEGPTDPHVHVTKMLFSSLSAAVNWPRRGALCILHGA